MIAPLLLVGFHIKMQYFICVRILKVSSPKLFGIGHFLLSDVEKTLMSLRLLQHPNPRHPPIDGYCLKDPSHPAGFEPPYRCEADICATCTALRMGREFINGCFVAQHQENTRESVHGELIVLRPKNKEIFSAFAKRDLIDQLYY